MIDKDKVLEIVKNNGPVIPRDIMKRLGTDTFIIGAVLSQLKDSNAIKVSHTKIGGSPFYYAPGQEQKLQQLYEHLHDKEKKAYDILKKSNILQDSKQSPVIRVALRNIKDFAKLLEVNLGGRRELFWKWYLLPNIEAESLIRQQIIKYLPEREEIREEVPVKQKPIVKQQEAKSDIQRTDKKPVEKREVSKKAEPEDDFLKHVKTYFNNKEIEIVEERQIKKNREFDFVIKLPTAAGKHTYYCKAKKKKKYNEGDLSTAYVSGETKKLSVLFIATGKLTKRAQQMLSNEFKNINIVYLS
ncbi:hypothetical protein JW930_03945 [Candidatus Woesearchaeota archaeon]|nr:hypothetical protein [Candidatus Woesearchaeota archaeon]